MESFSPYTAVLLTGIFAGFVALVMLFARDCISGEDCSTEGVQNTVIFWSTDFFVAVVATILAIHLNRTTSQGVATGLTFLTVALGYLSNGFNAIFFGNSGTDDGKGMMQYYIMSILTHICWTCSALLFYHWFDMAWHLLDVSERP